MKKILVPTDFSKISQNANEYAITMAENLNAKILFFHAFHFPVTHPIAPTYDVDGEITPSREIMEEHEEKINENLIELCRQVKIKTNEKIECDYLSRTGFFIDKILETVIDEEIELIVMGSKGVSGLKEVIFGSNAALLMEKATCPVIAVPGAAEFKPMTKILFTTDYHENDVKNLNKLTEFAEKLNSHIMVLHIDDDHDENQLKKFEEFRNMLQSNVGYSNMSFRLLENDDIVLGIKETVEENGIDLVAMTIRKKGFFRNIFSANIAEKMIYHSRIPLIAFNEHMKF